MSDVQTEPLFLGRPDGRLFGVLHHPARGREPRGSGWLFCPGFADEQDNAQRILVEWAHALSREGFWVLRFDPRGSGNGEGPFERFTPEDALDDILSAAHTLQQRSGVPLGGLCGLRLGGSLAAITRVRQGWQLPLLLWEPVVDGSRYADELLRSAMMTQMLKSGGAAASRNQLRQVLSEGGTVAVRGYPIRQAYHRALCDIDLLKLDPLGSQPILLVQIDPRPSGQTRPALAALQQTYAHQAPTTLEQVVVSRPWGVTNTDYCPRPATLFDPSLRWVREQAQGAAQMVPPPPHAQPAVVDLSSAGSARPERAVEFALDGQLIRGILHIPPSCQPSRPVVLMPVMSAPFHVQLAAELGRHGWTSLRYDPRGKGESEGHLPFPSVAEVHHAVQGGLLVADLAAAVDFVARELGSSAVIPLGICGDALTAVCHAPQDPRVVALAPLELPFLYAPVDRLPGPLRRVRQWLADKIHAHPSAALQQVRRLLYAGRWRYRRWAQWIRRAVTPGSVGHAPEIAELLGERANLGLIEALLKCLDHRLPMLLVYGSQRMDGPSGFERIDPKLRQASPAGMSRLSYRILEGADHHFSTPEHRANLFRLLLQWLEAPDQPWAGRSTSDGSPAEPRHGG